MILFYGPDEPYGCFSNFSRHPVEIYGRLWKTSEAAFQAMKFWPHRPDLMDLVHEAASPGTAARIGRDRSYPLRQDWELAPKGPMLDRVPQIVQPNDLVSRPGVEAEPLFTRTKDVFMFEVCLAKFQQNAELRKVLLHTSKPLIENSTHDPYWGWGASHVGENKLGRILMVVRDMLQTL